MRAGLAAFAVILAATAAQAGELRGRVVAVADGDTLTILDAGTVPCSQIENDSL